MELTNEIRAAVYRELGTVCFSWRRNARPFFLLEG